MARRLLAWSVLHDGESLVGLAPSVVEYLSKGSVPKVACRVTMDDVCDLELKDIIQKVGKVRLIYIYGTLLEVQHSHSLSSHAQILNQGLNVRCKCHTMSAFP